MGCKCREREWRDVLHAHTKPNEPCLYCCEKHLSTAWALQRERGYEVVNRQAIIGEMVGAALHLPLDETDLSAKILNARHAIQDSHTKEPDVDWEGLMRDIDGLISKAEAAEAVAEKSKSNQ